MPPRHMRPRVRRNTGGLLSMQMQGSRELGELARRLREAGRRDLQKELDQELRKPPRRLQSAVMAAIPPHMPKGYERPLAFSLKWKTTIRTRGKSGAAVRVTVSSSREIRQLDLGRLRHPVFGDPETWVTQKIKPFFFSGPADRVLRRVREQMLEVLERVAAKIGD